MKNFIFWILFFAVVAGAINWGAIAAMGPKGEFVKRLSMGNNNIDRGIKGAVGVSGLTLLLMVLAYEKEQRDQRDQREVVQHPYR